MASLTDPGHVRPANEDSLLAACPVFVVADGMGGYEAGDRASAAVVDAFRTLAGEHFVEVEGVREALVGAAAGVAAVAGGTTRGAGSTVAGIAMVEHGGIAQWLVFNVGDSRVYRLLDGQLEQLTVDHSLGQELVNRGELRPDELFGFPERNIITRAIGAADSVADSWLHPVITGERLLICSDGLHSELQDETIRATLTLAGGSETTAVTLVQRAKDAGGRDNVSVIVVDVVSGGNVVADEIDETTLPVRPRA